MFTKMKLFNVLTLSVGVLLCSCSSDGDGGGDNTRKEIELTPEEAVIAANEPSLALDMLKYFDVNSDEDNFMVSPLSAQFCLGMLANGAEGNTLTELETALKVTSLDELNSLNRQLSAKLPRVDKKTVFRSANSMWLNKDFKVLPDYSLLLSKFYNAEATSLDLTSGSAINRINRWCSDKTNGMIPTVFKEPFDDNVRMVLINALYFKGEWSEPFKKENTSDKEFTNADGSKVRVPMMQDSRREVRRMREDGYCMFSLDYGNGAYRMIVILPSDGYPLGEVLESFSMDDWTQWKRVGQVAECPLWMPKFKIETDFEMNDYLKSRGVEDAYDSFKADFSNLSQEDIYLSRVRQITNIEIDEKGTEAAAVTVSDLYASAAGPIKPGTEIHVDHPFAFLIEEKSTGTILFAGRVNKL